MYGRRYKIKIKLSPARGSVPFRTSSPRALKETCTFKCEIREAFCVINVKLENVIGV